MLDTCHKQGGGGEGKVFREREPMFSSTNTIIAKRQKLVYHMLNSSILIGQTLNAGIEIEPILLHRVIISQH